MWPFSKNEEKSIPAVQEIALDSDNNDIASVLLGLSTGQPINLSYREAFNLSERNSDLGTAVSRISQSISNIILGVLNNDGDIYYDSPVLELLANPGEGSRQSQFMGDIAESYLLTNEAWVIARGNISRPPLSIVSIRPYDVDVDFDNASAVPARITTQSPKDRRIYYRTENGTGYRFIDRQGLNELFPIIGATTLSDGWRGRSPLVKLYYDVLMNTDGKRHNTSLLQNGMRTTGILTPKGGKDVSSKWNQQAVDKLTDKVRSFNQGAGNAGNVLVIGDPAEIQGVTQSNQDMDFLELLKNSQVAIYNMFKIPLPLILPSTMTLDNYTQAVLPVLDNILDGLTVALRGRYGLAYGEVLGYSEVDIRDLRPVLVENMKMLRDTRAVTVNEVRAVGGYEPDVSGDVILIPSSEVPLEGVVAGPSFADTEIPEEFADEQA